jgi:hypothetical protein
MKFDMYTTDTYYLDDWFAVRCKNGKKGEIRDIREFVDKIMQGHNNEASTMPL